MSFTLLPDEPKQALRIRRLFMALAVWGLSAIPLTYCAITGLMMWQPALAMGFVVLLYHAAFYLIMRTDLNKRFDDPSMTTQQIATAIPLIIFGLIFCGEARGAFLVTPFVALVFGCFILKRSTLIWLSIFAVLGLVASLPLIAWVDGPRFNQTREIGNLLIFATFLPFLSILAGGISSLRFRLMEKNTELATALHTINELATHDELTGIYNRRYIMDVMRHEKNRTDRGGGCFCICIMDIDFFKRVNDTYGHGAGDEVLKTFAKQTQNLLRTTDFFGRWGGEEFVLMLPNTSMELALICLERIRELMESTRFPEIDRDLQVTVSQGLVQYALPEAISATLERADVALYRAKRNGRNRVETMGVNQLA